MGLSQRFQNLILDSRRSGAKWLRRVDLTRQLFGKTETTAVQGSNSQIPSADLKMMKGIQLPNPISRFRKIAAHLKMERIQLPSPIFRFQDATAFGNVYCFPLASSKVVLADQTGRTFLWHADTFNVVPMANLNKPKSRPVSLFVPSADGQSSSYGSLYIMEKLLEPDRGPSTQPSDQFEALVHIEGMWHSRCLPLPTFIYRSTCPKLTSYAVVGTRIYISIDHKATYWLDTTNNAWEVDKEVLLSTFLGKLEYVPEFKLWFGFSVTAAQFAAVDLSARDIPAQLVGDCREFDAPEGWLEVDYPQLAYLGSGRFCITRFFENYPMDGDLDMTVMIVVFTGVEVTPVVHDGNCSGSRNGEVKLQMKKHNSRYHVCDATMICHVL